MDPQPTHYRQGAFDPDTEDIVTQSDAMPQGGAYPTSWWIKGEVVSETVTLPLEGVPGGEYRLAVGLYDRTVTRLPKRSL